MADVYDPLPGAEAAATSAATPGPMGDIAGRWRDWMQDPGNRASLMQFGITLMQPLGYGQNAVSKFGEALGAGGEAAARREALDIKQQEAASKADLRESQALRAESGAREAAGTAEARRQVAEAATSKAETAAQNLTLQEALRGHTTAATLAKEYYNAKLLYPNLTEEDFMKSVQKFTPQSTMRPGAAKPGAPAAGAAGAPKEGEVREFQLRDGTRGKGIFKDGRWQPYSGQ